MSELTLKIAQELRDGKRHMSHSQISKYAKCPLAWKFYVVDRLRSNRIDTAIGKRTLGKLVHLGLDQNARLTAEGLPVDLQAIYEEWLEETVIEMGGLLAEEYDMLKDIIIQAVMIVNKTVAILKANGYKWKTVLDVNGEPVIEYEVYSTLPNGIKMLSYIDWLVFDEDYGVFRIIDFKTTGSLKSVGGYDNEVQISGIYNKALQQVGLIEGHAFSSIIEINAKVLKRPAMTKTGAMSRAQLHTTWEIYKEELELNGLDPNDYIDMRRKLMDAKFVTIHDILRTEAETNAIWNNRSEIVDNIIRALELDSFPANLNNMLCTSCEYKDACKECLGGFGYDELVDSGIYIIADEIEFDDDDDIETEVE